MAFASITHVLKYASFVDYVIAMKGFANYMRDVHAADTKGTIKESLTNVIMYFISNLPESFKAFKTPLRDLEKQEKEATPKINKRLSKWMKAKIVVVRMNIKKMDKTNKAAMNADSKYVPGSSISS